MLRKWNKALVKRCGLVNTQYDKWNSFKIADNLYLNKQTERNTDLLERRHLRLRRETKSLITGDSDQTAILSGPRSLSSAINLIGNSIHISQRYAMNTE